MLEEWLVEKDHAPDNREWLRCLRGDVVYCMAADPQWPDQMAMFACLYRDGLRLEGWLLQSCAAPTNAHKFYVRLFRSGEGEALGLTHSIATDGSSLIVERIWPDGLIDLWNRACVLTFPRDVVRRGDMIVAANGMQGEQIRAALQSSLAVKLCMQRPGSGERVFETYRSHWTYGYSKPKPKMMQQEPWEWRPC